MEHIGQLIAADRQRLGLSQQELAQRVGVTQQSISKWEDGRSSPRGKRLTTLVQALGTKSQTAAQLSRSVDMSDTPDSFTKGSDPVQQQLPTVQDQALLALAQAAQQIARAAQALAESVERMVESSQPPPSQH